ncbi:MAG: hypothetical protein ACK559_16295, partial [bacterium]
KRPDPGIADDRGRGGTLVQSVDLLASEAHLGGIGPIEGDGADGDVTGGVRVRQGAADRHVSRLDQVAASRAGLTAAGADAEEVSGVEGVFEQASGAGAGFGCFALALTDGAKQHGIAIGLDAGAGRKASCKRHGGSGMGWTDWPVIRR